MDPSQDKNAYHRGWTARNKAKRAAWSKADRLDHPERFNRTRRAWYARNRLREALRAAKRRARALGLPWDETIALEDNGACEACGRPWGCTTDTRPTIDRIRPERGYTSGNCALLCGQCNRRKADSSPEDLRRLADWIEHRG